MDTYHSAGSCNFNGRNSENNVTPMVHTGMRAADVGAHTSLHMSVSMDVDPLDQNRLHELRNILMMLDVIAHGRHKINWSELVDPSQPLESAKKISAALSKPTTHSDAYADVAKYITTPAHLSILALLDPPFRGDVRGPVLEEILCTLTSKSHTNPMPLCSEMFAEMVRLDLVALSGVPKTFETFLREPRSRRAGIAAIGNLANKQRGDEAFQRTLQEVEPLLRNIREPEYEYDCLTISRLFGWGGADKAAALVPVKTLAQTSPVTSMVYFRQRDELVSASCDSTVTIWGSPNRNTGEVSPAVIIDLPQYCVPVAMDGAARGNYLVIAGMSFPAASVQAMGGCGAESSKAKLNSLSGSIQGKTKGPLLRLLTCSENTGAWTNGDTLSRKENVTLTAVAALANLVVCAAESSPGEKAGTGIQHDLVFLNSHTTHSTRRIEHVHDDYTTVIQTGIEGDHILLTGSRDTVVKVWDVRSANGSGGGGSSGSGNRAAALTTAVVGSVTQAHRVENHKDTITAIVQHRKALLTASIDGSLFLWDTRKMGTPINVTCLPAPILDVTVVDTDHIAVSTARSLSLLLVETLKPVDILSNVVYTQLKSNMDGSGIFAAGSAGISVYGVRH